MKEVSTPFTLNSLFSSNTIHSTINHRKGSNSLNYFLYFIFDFFLLNRTELWMKGFLEFSLFNIISTSTTSTPRYAYIFGYDTFLWPFCEKLKWVNNVDPESTIYRIYTLTHQYYYYYYYNNKTDDTKIFSEWNVGNKQHKIFWQKNKIKNCCMSILPFKPPPIKSTQPSLIPNRQLILKLNTISNLERYMYEHFDSCLNSTHFIFIGFYIFCFHHVIKSVKVQKCPLFPIPPHVCVCVCLHFFGENRSNVVELMQPTVEGGNAYWSIIIQSGHQKNEDIKKWKAELNIFLKA